MKEGQGAGKDAGWSCSAALRVQEGLVLGRSEAGSGHAAMWPRPDTPQVCGIRGLFMDIGVT